MKFKINSKISFIILGIASTVWFLIRVIPKPSRANYPCMRAAAPVMSSFIIYLMAISGSVMVFKKGKSYLAKSKYIVGAGLILLAFSLFFISTNLNLKSTYAQYKSAKTSAVVPNDPHGVARGIFPGRVVWAWNPDATNKNCTNAVGDGYFMVKNNDQTVINGMLDDAIIKLAGASDVKTAWSELFKSFNKRKGLGSIDYTPGQTIFIKVNLGGGSWLTNVADLSFITTGWQAGYYGMAETSPAAMIALLNQLVNVCGVPQQNIYLGDPISHIYKHVYDQLKALFPNVKYVDFSHSDLGRTKLTIPATPVIFYSDKGKVMPSAISDKLYTQMQNADYLIDIAALKAHARNGVSLNAKNNFGSQTRDAAGHLHNGLIAAENDIPTRTAYGQYRVLTDLMGHEKLGGNTLLFMIDGLWGGTEAVEKPVKWNMAPFNNDWPNSIFIAQDPVAIESVCMDFLRNEFSNPIKPGKARPQFGAIDDYLLQAADSSFWPTGILYDPENDGTIIGSLGICEHWNNAGKKQYSRNLGFNKGIEMVCTNPASLNTTVIAKEAALKPVFDGSESDVCWTNAITYPIDQTWITWGQKIDPSDFHGEFKVSWSSTENLMYYLVKITDNVFVDGYVYPNGNYPDFDIVEVFIDENKSGGLHVFDGTCADASNANCWGLKAANAFSYHLSTSKPADGGTSGNLVACDISGTDWSHEVIENYASHFPDFKMKRSGNVYTYEFSMKVYSEAFVKSNPENSRVALTEDKLMGMSMAYCDNDTPGGTRENFIGSVWVPQAQYNDHWKNADGYGSVRLVSSISSQNHAVTAISEIADFTLLEKNKPLVIVDDLTALFYDPDMDPLTFTVQCASSHLVFSTSGNKLTVTADATYSGESQVTVSASDGPTTASIPFKVIPQFTGLNHKIPAKLVVYPNPASENLFITLPEQTTNQNFEVQVFSINGMKVMHEKCNSKQADEVTRLNIGRLIPGPYLLKLTVGKDTFTQTFYKN